ncbi:MAG: hypothetical protein JO297_07505 [Nitrososphaeraceae archaeon]|nr:hypothetical protein [Nitrososphaeraceae archaeon]
MGSKGKRERRKREGGRANIRIPSTANILKAISDDKSLDLFKIIAFENPDSDTLLSRTKLTRKQYYYRIADLIKAGLVKRKYGKYFLSTTGKVVHNYHTIIESAINNYGALKAIDSLESSNNLSQEEYINVVNTLIDNNKIKNIILGL